jgi:hypothetical protein
LLPGKQNNANGLAQDQAQKDSHGIQRNKRFNGCTTQDDSGICQCKDRYHYKGHGFVKRMLKFVGQRGFFSLIKRESKGQKQPCNGGMNTGLQEKEPLISSKFYY